MLGVMVVAACSGGDAVPLDAYNLGCDPAVGTVTGGPVYGCANQGAPGVCTDDGHGAVQCFDECSNEPHVGYACAVGTPYVLVADGGERVCFCVP